MIFGAANKKKISELTLENEQLKQKIASLEDNVLSANQESEQLAQDMANNTERYTHQGDVNNLWLSSSELVDTIRQELAASSTYLVEQRDTFETSQQLFDDIMSMLAKTITTTEKITNDSKEASTSVDNLKSATAGINDFVNIIKGISDQTNLLALNAAIEAARAGEQGRGFAVVADEVRTLAQRSAEASNEISGLIEQVNQQMEEVINGIHEVAEKSDTISTSTSSIENTATSIVDVSKKMYTVITNSTADAFLQTVKMDHVVWKSEVYQVIMGISNKQSNDFTDHHGCRLGKWYYQGEGAEKYTSMNSFKRIEKSHAQVHTHGLNALQAKDADNMALAVKELAVMENASIEVINCLTALSHEINGQ